MTKNKDNKKVKNLKGSNPKDIALALSKMQLKDSKKTPKSPTETSRKRRLAQKEIKDSIDPMPPKDQAGLLVTGAFNEMLAECKKKVELIAKQCRATNRKFRDIEFDLEKDQALCRFGLTADPIEPIAAVGVKRVTEIFDEPVFFGSDGPNASDVRQGELGDCWFLAALSAVSTVPNLVQKLCVARDEEVGVYGFIFFRDCNWHSVIIDDLLFWSPPKFDELTTKEKKLYHNDRNMYHQVAEKTGKGLKYARSGTVGETWVPLIEKAYAKFHGDYASLDGGFLSDGIEDLTGGVATAFQMSDLLSSNKFWKDELRHFDRRTRLFGVALNIDKTRSEILNPTVQGLFPEHAYSVLRAHECKGKRFVVVRNPWGESEWTGPWADGSKEWKGEWLQVLDDLKHEFGNDGQFVMEYSDFLSVFNQIDRTTLFNASWAMSYYWLHIPMQPDWHPWTYGDAFYYFTLNQASSSVIVLSQTDHRYFSKLHSSEDPWWLLDFVVYRKGSSEPVGMSGVSLGSPRSVSCELYLEAGDYVVLPRMEPRSPLGKRKSRRMRTEWAKSRQYAANYDSSPEMEHCVPITPEVALALGLEPKDPITTSDAEDTDTDDDEDAEEKADSGEDDKEGNKEGANEDDAASFRDNGSDIYDPGAPWSPEYGTNLLFVGLRVYTQNEAVATISGQAKEDYD